MTDTDKLKELREESFYLWESRRDWPSVVKYIRNAVLDEAARLSEELDKKHFDMYGEPKSGYDIAIKIRALKDGGVDE